MKDSLIIFTSLSSPFTEVEHPLHVHTHIHTHINEATLAKFGLFSLPNLVLKFSLHLELLFQHLSLYTTLPLAQLSLDSPSTSLPYLLYVLHGAFILCPVPKHRFPLENLIRLKSTSYSALFLKDFIHFHGL